MKRSLRFVPLVLLAGASVSASANVTFFDLFKTADFVQTSDDQPVDAVNWRFASRILTDGDDEVTSATLTLPDTTTTVNMTSFGPRGVIFADSGYASSADLNNAYPNGDYTFEVTGGSLYPGGKTETLTQGDTDYPDSVPYLTLGSYTGLQNADVSVSHSVSWNTFSHSGDANTELVYFTIYDLDNSGAVVWDNNGEVGSYTGDTVNAGVLEAGHHYIYSLVFSSRVETPNAGFDGATGTVGSDFVTSGLFTAVPEPASILALAPGLLLLARRRRR